MANKVIILVGYPGSGKSTYASSHRDFTVINQDTLGNRKKCINATKNALKNGNNVIIDRTNINKQQRKIWIDLAKEYNVTEIECIAFRSNPKECIKRIETRKNHPTIKEGTTLEKITEIVRKFENWYEEPNISEGFSSITFITTFHPTIPLKTDNSSRN